MDGVGEPLMKDQLFIREANVEDAEPLTNLILQVERESEFMLFEADERKITAEQQRNRIEQMKEQNNSTMLVAEVKGKLVGYLFAIGGRARRNQHTAYLVIGILQEYRGKGIGTQLFTTLERWAKEQRLHRLELTVVATNETAIALYKKMGFQIEGTKKDSLLINGEFVDEYYMAKLLS